MSKRFKRQDYFRYKRLGKKWRRPVGWQSKLRLRKGGAGLKVAVGYGTSGKMKPTLVRSLKDIENASKYGIIIAASVGSKKTAVIAARARELGITVLNMKKIRKAERVAKDISKKKTVAKKEKHSEHKHEEHVHKDGEHKHEEHVHKHEHSEHRMGFHEDVVPQVLEGKTKTYRLRDHNLHVGDEVALENTQKKEVFGRAKIMNIERVPVGNIDLKDPGHHRTYDRVDELIDALKRHNPDRKITPETEVLIYTYKFIPIGSDKKEKQ